MLSQEISATTQPNTMTIEGENTSPSTKRSVQTLGTNPENIIAILYVILLIVHRYEEGKSAQTAPGTAPI